MTRSQLIGIVLLGLVATSAGSPDPATMHLHVAYRFKIGVVSNGTVAKVLISFRNDSSKTESFNGSDYYPTVELFTLDGHKLLTREEIESARTHSRIVVTKCYIPDRVVVPPKASITREYDFAPWSSYDLEPGLYMAKVSGNPAEFRFRFAR